MANLTEIAGRAIKADSSEYIRLIEETTKLLASEKGQIGDLDIQGRLVEVKSFGEIVVIGDLHGDLESFVYILKDSSFMEKAASRNSLLVFLGDYGDRGLYSPEVYYIVLKLKHLFPQNVVLMRGNHEGPEDLMASPHDLPENMEARFGEESTGVYSKIRAMFPNFHSAVVVNEFCVLIHGGVPSQANSIEDLKYAHLKHPRENYLEEILWSDPSDDIKGIRPSPRGAGKLFGEDVTQNFLEMLGVKTLIRGHEPAEKGFKINHNGRVLTLFSRKGAPYFNTSAAYLHLDLALKPKNAYGLRPYIRVF